MAESCICCANGNDLPEGEYCRACLRGADRIFMSLEGAELDAFLREIGMEPAELLAQFNTAVFEKERPVTIVRNYDEKSYELACHFLADTPSLDKEAARDDLAKAIQQAVEDWFFMNPPVGEAQEAVLGQRTPET